MVRELFEMARSKKACIIFFDEVDAIGGARFDDGAGGDNEVQRTMLELINQLDGFDPRGNIKVLMATNRFVLLDLCSAMTHTFVGRIPLIPLSYDRVV
jgi:26S proteasome regulatory subunit T1